MDDVVIGDYVIVGAGSLVPSGKKLETGYLYLGSPAKQVRALKESEKEFLKYSCEHYLKLKDAYLAAK
jgi:carbonic anhydrase/acetyltransferase-like protein (isoleucine patch superfamily)